MLKPLERIVVSNENTNQRATSPKVKQKKNTAKNVQFEYWFPRDIMESILVINLMLFIDCTINKME